MKKRHVLLCGIGLILVTALLFLIIGHQNQSDTQKTQETPTYEQIAIDEYQNQERLSTDQAASETHPENNTGTLKPEQAEPSGTDISDAPIQVDFYVEGKLFNMKHTEFGANGYPEKTPVLPGKVFQGWDMPLNDLLENTSTTAIFLNVQNLKNCFAAESTYTNPDGMAVMRIRLCGDVSIATADFVIHYSADKLILEDIRNLDPGILVNADQESGEIRCSLLANDNISGEVDCMELVFTASGDESDAVPVTIEIEDAAAAGDEIVSVEANPVDGTVFILKEYH